MIYDVTALGEFLIDFAPVGTDEGGYPVLAAKPGGAPPNFLAALAEYGAKTAHLSKVGTDAFGKLLIGTLRKAGIETSGIVEDHTVFTTLAFVTLDADGDRSFSFARKPGADTCLRFDELKLSLIDEAKIFHFGTLSLTSQPVRQTTQKAVEYAKAGGKLITFDPNLRESLWDSLDEAKTQILWGLEQADVVKISDEEVDFLWGCSAQEGARRLMEQYSIKLAMVTLGPWGAYLENRNAAVLEPCPVVKPIDTTGAGDIFGGSAVSRILRLGKAPEDLSKEELESITVFAVTAASLSTQKLGGIPSVPCEEEVYATIHSSQCTMHSCCFCYDVCLCKIFYFISS
jgi:sugar/nucleoside kinase (ribokinase family)